MQPPAAVLKSATNVRLGSQVKLWRHYTAWLAGRPLKSRLHHYNAATAPCPASQRSPRSRRSPCRAEGAASARSMLGSTGSATMRPAFTSKQHPLLTAWLPPRCCSALRAVRAHLGSCAPRQPRPSTSGPCQKVRHGVDRELVSNQRLVRRKWAQKMPTNRCWSLPRGSCWPRDRQATESGPEIFLINMRPDGEDAIATYGDRALEKANVVDGHLSWFRRPAAASLRPRKTGLSLPSSGCRQARCPPVLRGHSTVESAQLRKCRCAAHNQQPSQDGAPTKHSSRRAMDRWGIRGSLYRATASGVDALENLKIVSNAKLGPRRGQPGNSSSVLSSQ